MCGPFRRGPSRAHTSRPSQRPCASGLSSRPALRPCASAAGNHVGQSENSQIGTKRCLGKVTGRTRGEGIMRGGTDTSVVVGPSRGRPEGSWATRSAAAAQVSAAGSSSIRSAGVARRRLWPRHSIVTSSVSNSARTTAGSPQDGWERRERNDGWFTTFSVDHAAQPMRLVWESMGREGAAHLDGTVRKCIPALQPTSLRQSADLPASTSSRPIRILEDGSKGGFRKYRMPYLLHLRS